ARGGQLLAGGPRGADPEGHQARRLAQAQEGVGMTSLPSSEDLVAHVTEAYIAADGELDNDQLYQSVADRAGIPESRLNERSPIGRDGTPRSTIKRAIRWRQQELKA